MRSNETILLSLLWLAASFSTYFRINLSVADTLIPSKLIARHHKKTHGIDEFAHIAIVLNVDELNQISIQWDTSTSSKRWQAAG